MQVVLSITIPFFAIIFLGSFFRFIKIFNEESSRILTKFALYITLPPYIFLNIIKSSNNKLINWEFIIRFEIITILILFSCYFFSKFNLKYNNENSSLFSLNAAYPNYGYLGIPLCILSFGENASIPISLILLSDSIVLFTITSYLAQINDFKKFRNFLINFYKIFKNPILLSVILGFFFLILDININIQIFNFLSILSVAAPPTALFAIGITLVSKINRNYIYPIILITIIRLFIHPTLIFLIFLVLPGNNIPNLWISTAILCSSLPVASNVFAMAGFYNSFLNQTSNSIMLTTILSTFTTPIVLYFLLNHYSL